MFDWDHEILNVFPATSFVKCLEKRANFAFTIYFYCRMFSASAPSREGIERILNNVFLKGSRQKA